MQSVIAVLYLCSGFGCCHRVGYSTEGYARILLNPLEYGLHTGFYVVVSESRGEISELIVIVKLNDLVES